MQHKDKTLVCLKNYVIRIDVYKRQNLQIYKYIIQYNTRTNVNKKKVFKSLYIGNTQKTNLHTSVHNNINITNQKLTESNSRNQSRCRYFTRQNNNIVIIGRLLDTKNKYQVRKNIFLLPCSIRKWKYGDGKKNCVRDMG